MEKRSNVIVLGIMVGLSICLRSTAQRDIDPEEIANTATAKRLVALGFLEEPVGSGVYSAELKWEEAQRTLGITQKDLRTVPSCSPDEWVRVTTVEGNHTVLRHAFDAGKYNIEADSPVRVYVDLGYMRPLCLFVGISLDRLATALAFIGATRPSVEPDRVLPSGRRSEQTGVIAAMLPDGRAFLAAYRAPRQSPQEKPSAPRVVAIFVSAAGQNFATWRPSEGESLQEFPISSYRRPKGQR